MIGLASIASEAFAFVPPPRKDIEQFISMNDLGNDPAWLALGHYSKPWFGSLRGEADSPEFYLAEDGKYNPTAEILASLEAMQEPARHDAPDQHPQCLMPARKRWLKETLGPEFGKLWLNQRCPELNWWLGELDVERVMLVFAAHYLSNPASMFGHTFIRLDTKQVAGRPPLLDYGFNYGAVSDPGEGLLYYLKGLTGFYPGRFGLQPYYQKVQEYSNFESRDIWEYELNLTPEQRDLLVLHVWELQNTAFDYYFLDENCSYHILGLIEVARPDLRLRESLRFWTDPAESVRVIAETPGVLARPIYRPSITSKIRGRLDQMNEEERQIAVAMIRGEEIVLPADWNAGRQALVLDSVLDYYHYLVKDLGEDATKDQKQRSHRLASARATLGPAAAADSTRRYSTAPELGHRIGFLGVNALGGTQGGGLGLRLHPAYHDLMADSLGYKENSEILLADINASLSFDESRWHIDRFRFFRVGLYAPPQGVEDYLSFEVEAAIGRDILARNIDDRFTWLEAGVGISRRLGPVVASFLAMTHAALRPGAHAHLGVGPKAQAFLPTDVGRIRASIVPWTIVDAGGEQRRLIADQLDYRMSINRHWDIWLSMQRREVVSLGVGRFF